MANSLNISAPPSFSHPTLHMFSRFSKRGLVFRGTQRDKCCIGRFHTHFPAQFAHFQSLAWVKSHTWSEYKFAVPHIAGFVKILMLILCKRPRNAYYPKDGRPVECWWDMCVGKTDRLKSLSKSRATHEKKNKQKKIWLGNSGISIGFWRIRQEEIHGANIPYSQRAADSTRT